MGRTYVRKHYRRVPSGGYTVVRGHGRDTADMAGLFALLTLPFLLIRWINRYTFGRFFLILFGGVILASLFVPHLAFLGIFPAVAYAGDRVRKRHQDTAERNREAALAETRRQQALAEEQRQRREAERQRERERETAAWQRQEAQRKAMTIDGMMSLSPREFEHAVADLLREWGWTDVQVVGKAGDQGADITGRDPYGAKGIVQAKRWGAPVGDPTVRLMLGDISVHGADVAMIVTTSSFTVPAQLTAKRHGIRLVDGGELAEHLHAKRTDREGQSQAQARSMDDYRRQRHEHLLAVKHHERMKGLWNQGQPS